MLRHKKEMKQHRLAEFNKKLEELYRERANESGDYSSDKFLWVKYNQLIDKLAKEYGVNWNNRELMGFYWSHVVNKPWHRVNPKSDANRTIRRTVIKRSIKPMKQRFKEEIEDYESENN